MTDLELRKFLYKNLSFHAILTGEINSLPYGQITVNVQLKDSTVVLETLNIVKNRRKKYSVIDKETF
jgi:hypothetical protein